MLLFIFIDGIGVGADQSGNPFSAATLPGFVQLCGGKMVAGRRLDEPGRIFRPIDAGLGIEGLPQSATGQTTLFTGVNGPQLEGMHISSFPTRALRQAIAEHSFLKRARAAGRRVAFANAYSPHYWQLASARRNRHSVSTWTNLAADLPFRDFGHLARGEAVYWDITHELANASYAPELSPIDPREAGRRLARLSAAHDLVLYETFVTDLAGHRRIPWTPAETLARIDAMLLGVLEAIEPAVTLLITSDHGNLEDPDTKGHTYNPVPLIVRGPCAPHFDAVTDLTGIVPAIFRCLGIESAPAIASPDHP